MWPISFSPSGGHYVAFAKNGPRHSWYEFNDTHVHPVTADTVVGAEGYVLFYRSAAARGGGGGGGIRAVADP